MRNICIYHSRDLDGWMSAAIVKTKYPDAELIGWDYGDQYPLTYDDDNIIMVDISFPRSIMIELNEANPSFIWIDHHISAIKEMETYIPRMIGSQLTSKAACELTWEYFFPDTKMPEIVRLLGRYDCFGHKGTAEEQTVLEFQYGARAAITNTEDAYKYLTAIANCSDPPETTITSYIRNNGRAIYKYLCIEAEQAYANRFEMKFDGYSFAVVNKERFNPINFGINYHNDGYDGFACFWYANGLYNFSLYNDNGKVDCSIIAKNRGGGGHKGASGFRVDHIVL